MQPPRLLLAIQNAQLHDLQAKLDVDFNLTIRNPPTGIPVPREEENRDMHEEMVD